MEDKMTDQIAHVDPISASSVILETAGFPGAIIVVMFGVLYYFIKTHKEERAAMDLRFREERAEWITAYKESTKLWADLQKESSRVWETSQKEQNLLLKQLFINHDEIKQSISKCY
jgi:hypothetical protein